MFRAGFRYVAAKSETKKVMDIGHVIDLIDLPQHVEIDLAGLQYVHDFFLVESRF